MLEWMNKTWDRAPAAFSMVYVVLVILVLIVVPWVICFYDAWKRSFRNAPAVPVVPMVPGCKWIKWCVFCTEAAIPLQMLATYLGSKWVWWPLAYPRLCSVRFLFWIADKLLESGAKSLARTYRGDSNGK